MLLSSDHFTFVVPIGPCHSLPNAAFAKARRTVTVISREMQRINPATIRKNCSALFVRGFVLLESWQSLVPTCRKALGDSHPPGDTCIVFSLKVILEKCHPPLLSQTCAYIRDFSSGATQQDPFTCMKWLSAEPWQAEGFIKHSIEQGQEVKQLH